MLLMLIVCYSTCTLFVAILLLFLNVSAISVNRTKKRIAPSLVSDQFTWIQYRTIRMLLFFTVSIV